MRRRIKWVVAQIHRHLDLIENEDNHRIIAEIRGLLNELINI